MTIEELFAAIDNCLSPNGFSCSRNVTVNGNPLLHFYVNGHSFRMIAEATTISFVHYFTCPACLHLYFPSKQSDTEFDLQSPSLLAEIIAHATFVKSKEVWEVDPAQLRPLSRMGRPEKST